MLNTGSIVPTSSFPTPLPITTTPEEFTINPPPLPLALPVTFIVPRTFKVNVGLDVLMPTLLDVLSTKNMLLVCPTEKFPVKFAFPLTSKVVAGLVVPMPRLPDDFRFDFCLFCN
jgi:hypothetical protein